jgi:hypothetical protein
MILQCIPPPRNTHTHPREGADKVVRVGELGGIHHVLVRGALLAALDVVADRASKELRVVCVRVCELLSVNPSSPRPSLRPF